MADDSITIWAQSVYERYKRQIASMLGIDPPQGVKFQLTNLPGSTIADTDAASGLIRLDKAHFTEQPNDIGAIIHEAVHAFQNVPGGVNGKLIEGIADAVRFALEPSHPDGWAPSPAAQRFLELSPEQFSNVSTSMANGTFQQGDLKKAIAASNPNSNSEGYGGQYWGKAYKGQDPASAVAQTGPGGDWGKPPTVTTNDGTKKQQANARATFMGILQTFGIDMTPALRDIVINASTLGYNQARFLNALRQTDEYKERFVGIFKDDGTMKMDESTYINNLESYNSIAEQVGINLGPKLEGWLFENNVSVQEFQDRAAADAQIRNNPELYAQFTKALVQEGVVTKPGDISKKEMLKFVLGEKNKEWTDVWNLSRARYAASQAGISMQKGADRYLALNPGIIAELSKKGYSDTTLSEDFGALAKNLLEVMPLSKLQGYNLSKQDLVDAAFGGKKSATVQEKIKHIVATDEAFNSGQTAAAQVYAGQGGGPAVAGYKPEKAAAD